ncbi:hypothetical protein K6T82_21650 [Flavobacterium sp. 17A]|uniref:Uncharacterized protein n=1 Tax=Flavobacterium potami TaxID=2872310 RepID=A0A9X1HEN9_9FLAO|nr:hypothetical protein [Flavobacterium potami]MBZ4037380.1 hypothetical protein [Flavobacterium potami]
MKFISIRKETTPSLFASAKIDRKFKKQIAKVKFNITFAKKASFFRELCGFVGEN